MRIMELEGTQFSTAKNVHTDKESDREKIETDIAAFMDKGGAIKSIPRGLSGIPYSPRTLTPKEARKKINTTIARQRMGRQK